MPVKYAFGLRWCAWLIVGMLRAKGRLEAGNKCGVEMHGTIQAWGYSRRVARISYKV